MIWQAQVDWSVVQVGRDPRISGPIIAAALAAGLTSKGVHVARFGYATTPAMFMSTIAEGVQEPSQSCSTQPLSRTYFPQLGSRHSHFLTHSKRLRSQTPLTEMRHPAQRVRHTPQL